MSILLEAEQIINGERREAYGDVRESFAKIAALWSVVLGVAVTPSQVALCMTLLKIQREANKPGYDNRLDAIGYIALLDKLTEVQCTDAQKEPH